MAPRFHLNEVDAAMQRGAIPATAQQDHQLDRSRQPFDRDDLAPYSSPTDDANGDNNMNSDDDVNSDYNISSDDDDPGEGDPDLFDCPFNELELDALFTISVLPCAHDRYLTEASQETGRLHTYIHAHPVLNQDFVGYLQGPMGDKRQKVIIRHYIKKRWERLGVWNPLWGIPGRVNERRIDKPATWKWRWEREYDKSDPHHPLRRAIALRRGLRRGESGPVHPRGYLPIDASRDEAEDFLTSRPFFMLDLEVDEESQRMVRSFEKDWDIGDIVLGRWEQRKDWKGEWNDPDSEGHIVLGWTWPHENDESEVPPYEELESIDDIEFTPSEVDALEAIEEESELQHARTRHTTRQAMELPGLTLDQLMQLSEIARNFAPQQQQPFRLGVLEPSQGTRRLVPLEPLQRPSREPCSDPTCAEFELDTDERGWDK